MFRLGICSLAAAAVFSTGCSLPVPQKLLDVVVERDGKAVLKGGFGVGASTTAAEGWYQLEGQRLRAVEAIAPDPADPNTATLTGELRVALTHDGKQFAAALLDRLRVVRVRGSDDLWEIPRDELERATKPALRPGFEKKKP